MMLSRYSPFISRVFHSWAFAFIGIPLILVDSYQPISTPLDDDIEQNESIVSIGKNRSNTTFISVKAGWNIVSLPLEPISPYLLDNFPSVTSSAYSFRKSYVRKDTLKYGIGYWMKFDSAETFSIVGNSPIIRSIPIEHGWNLIGAMDTAVSIYKLFSEPSTQAVTSFYSYDPDLGYIESDTLIPGFGYWMKSDINGSLVLDAHDTAWVKVSDIVLETFAIDTSHPDIFYGGIRSVFPIRHGRFYKSTDRGITWDTILTDLDVGGITIDPVDSGTVYLTIGLSFCGYYPGLPSGLLKSLDGGESWLRMENGMDVDCDTGPYKVLVDWSDNDNLYVETGGIISGTLYRSTNGGQSWYIPFDLDSLNCITDPRCGLADIPKLIQSQYNPDLIYALVDGFSPPEYLLKGVNDATEWIYLDTLPQGPFADVETHPALDSMLYSGGRGFYHSTNEGMTWLSTSVGLPDSAFVWQILPLKNSPTVFITVFYDEIIEIYNSTDAGQSWNLFPFEYNDATWLSVDEKNMILYAKAGDLLYRRRLK